MSGGGYPFAAELCNGTQAETATSLWGITIPSTTVHTKGSWTTVIASSPVEACWIDVTVMSGGNPNRCVLDIGIGGSGSEQAIISNLMFSPASNYFLCTKGPFPLVIPAGTRISARYQSDYGPGSDSCSLQVGLYSASWMTPSFAGMDDLSFVSGNTAGTAITAGNQVMGSYTQLVSSTSKDYVGLFVVHDSFSRTASDQGGFDIAIGAAASEQVIIPHLGWSTNINDVPSGFIYPIPIPAGTRIAARAYYIRAGDTAPTINLYGIYK